MLRVGLTGGIACGKSVVLRRLRDRGIATIDLDLVSRAVTGPGSECLARLVRVFGASILSADGSLDRKALGALVFADAEARARLNAIVHPAVRAEEERLAGSLGREAPLLVVDGALLLEAGVHLRFDRLAVVHCAPAIQLVRLRARDGLDEAAALARIEAQMPLAEKRRYAHYDLDSSGTVAETEERADRLGEKIEELARAPVTRIAVASSRVAACLRHGPAGGAAPLRPIALLRELALSASLELSRIAELAGAAEGEPWHRFESRSPPHPAMLAVPSVLWALLRRGEDAELLDYAMVSVARACGAPAPVCAAACAFAAILAHIAATGRIGADLPSLASEAEKRARRWCYAEPEPRWRGAVAAAVARPSDPAAARDLASATGADPGMAGALVGLAAPGPSEAADAELARLLSALERNALGV
jgi:dephospho-CoA kinase